MRLKPLMGADGRVLLDSDFPPVRRRAQVSNLRLHARHLRWSLIGLSLAGLGLSSLMLARGLLGSDELNLLARGWMWVAEGQFIPYGNPMSSGGKSPGAMTTLLVGLPLMVWSDARAPVVVILVFHVLAYLLLDRALRDVLRPVERLLLCIFYWLNPWRIYHSGFLWNPNYLFLFGAIHLWSARRLQQRGPRFWPSFVHGAAPVLAFQLHVSAALLFGASLVLYVRRYLRLQWLGLVVGLVVGALPLVPWVVEVWVHPSVAATEHGFPGRGLLLVFPLVRGILYLLRYASLNVSNKMSTFDFAGTLGTLSSLLVGGMFFVITNVIGSLMVLLALLAWLRLFRWDRKRPWRCPDLSSISARAWLRGYLTSCFVGAVMIFALAPTTPMQWQGLLLFHVAVLVPVLWVGALSRSRWARPVFTAIVVLVVLDLVTTLGMTFGVPHYRCGGRLGLNLALRGDHPMLHELHVVDRCPYPFDPAGGWWPDVLSAPR
jgi:hypothetical protein